MPVSSRTLAGIKQSSWIRQMFEAGERLKAELGPERVFDLSLGNPVIEPPVQVKQALLGLVSQPRPEQGDGHSL